MTVQRAHIDVRRLPVVVDLPTAARLLGIGRTSAYELLRTGHWPTPVIRVEQLIRVPAAPCRPVPSGSRSNDGQTIKGPTTVSGDQASDLHFFCSGGRI